MTLLQATNISVDLANRPVLKGLSLTLDRGEFVGLIGPNGAGKTTLLRAIGSLVPVEGGEISLDHNPVQSLSRQLRAQLVAYLAQGAAAHWPLTVRRLVALGRLPRRTTWQRLSDQDAEAIDQAMQDADVVHLADRSVNNLSGGELKRVMLARALASGPALLLADEPVAGLDPAHQIEIMELMRRQADAGQGVLAVLHDLTLASRFCHRVVVLSEGATVADGKPSDVMSDDILQRVFGINVEHATVKGETVVLPWSTL